MKLIEYGTWTIGLNVNDCDTDYVKIYKGHIEPSWRDIEILGGPVIQITHGKAIKKYNYSTDCSDSIYRTDLQKFDPYKTWKNYVGTTDLLGQNPFVTVPYLDMIL